MARRIGVRGFKMKLEVQGLSMLFLPAKATVLWTLGGRSCLSVCIEILTFCCRPGMKAELLSDEVSTEGWGVTVTENTGGLLALSYDSPDLKTSNTHTRLFCTSSRLLPCGTIASSPALSFEAPACLRAKKYPDKVKNYSRSSFSLFTTCLFRCGRQSSKVFRKYQKIVKPLSTLSKSKKSNQNIASRYVFHLNCLLFVSEIFSV